MFSYKIDENACIECENQKLNYKEIHHFVADLQAVLPKSRQPIALYLNRNEYLVMSMIALVYLNIPYVILSKNDPSDRIKYILEDCNVQLIITQGKNNKLPNIPIIDIDLLQHNTLNDIKMEPHRDDDTIYILYTSGSTGDPKGVEISYSNINAFIEGFCERIPLTSKSRILCHTSSTFDIFFVETLLALQKGLAVIIADDSTYKNAKKLQKIIVDKEIDVLQITPSKLHFLLEYSPQNTVLANLKILMIGGEVFPQNLLKFLKDKTHASIYNLYGPTETTIWATIGDLTNQSTVNLGTPILNAQIFVLNKQEIPVVNEVGEIFITGQIVGKGYLHNPSLTNEKFRVIDLPSIGLVRGFKTGDYGRINLDGNLEYLYRIDNQIKLNGQRLELEDIESNMISMENISKCAVVYIQQDSGDSIVGFFVGQATPSAIRSFLQSKIPDFMIPSQLIQVDELPYTDNFKIDRKRLIENYQHQLFSNQVRTFANSKIDTDKRIIDIISLIGGLVISDDDIQNKDLVSLGINSIQFIKIIVEIEDIFDIRFDDEYLEYRKFENLRAFINYVNRKCEKE
ncbi:non-ribosomal peptide synthetase [Fumia xinanensis]|uniref:AMP-binding protein n=1 Tax=Fumia xinanensis TaxID=2763659 RepID=A0A926I3K9_9FIRM|nr:AMP-binding protein [Fumia xinanensis]MBC8560728.1 AMP-binding protein [Fumia xinanensis]